MPPRSPPPGRGRRQRVAARHGRPRRVHQWQIAPQIAFHELQSIGPGRARNSPTVMPSASMWRITLSHITCETSHVAPATLGPATIVRCGKPHLALAWDSSRRHGAAAGRTQGDSHACYL